MRTTASYLVMAMLGVGLLTAPPALASFGALVEPPAGNVYSPNAGPALVTFTFAPGDAATIFTVRIRKPGHSAIEEKDYLVDPATQSSPHDVSFSWPTLSVTAPTDYVIDVRRQDGGPALANEPFTLLPKLVSDLSVAPSPFYPLVKDGYRDRTKIGFSLSANTDETVVRVFKDDADGRCCGTAIRTEDLGALASGAHRWSWDGARGDGSSAPKGRYFVRVQATDTDAVSVLSGAQKVLLATATIRKTATKEKDGSAYERAADKRETAIGGDCYVARNDATHEANILCANAEISVYWKWALKPGQRLESVSFVIDGGLYGCHRKVSHTLVRSILRVHSPPTSTCNVSTAKMTYSYPTQI